MPVAEYEQETLKADGVLRPIVEARGKRLAFFRYPFLHTGATPETKSAIADFLAAHHYQPVTIAIHKGGGQCSDPPAAGYGQITWEKTITTTVQNAVYETDTMTLSSQASPGNQVPPPPSFAERDSPLPPSIVGFPLG